MRTRNEGEGSSYLDQDDELAQSADIQRLSVQSLTQNIETQNFLRENVSSNTIFSNVLIPFSGEAAEVEVIAPYLDNQSHVTVIDVSPAKVASSVKFVESEGVHSENITGIADFTFKTLKKLKSEGKKFDLAHIKLGLIWDPDYQGTIEALSDVMEKDGVVVIEDIDPASMSIEPKSESLDILSNALIEWRESHGYENKIGGKLVDACIDAGLKVKAVSEYQTPTQAGHPNHNDVFGFFKVAGPRMIEEGFISQKDYDHHMSTYSNDLEDPNTVMRYPKMKQVFAVKK